MRTVTPAVPPSDAVVPGAGVRAAPRTTTWVLAIAGLAVLARLPFVARPLGSDEGGFLLIASQWSPGRSLYGDYFVDRPPLLIDFFTLAHLLGGPVPLRVLGLGLVAASVVLAARIGVLAGGSARLGAATAAIFLVNPLFGVLQINGELIATPLVLAGIVTALESRRADARTRPAWLLLTGALGAAAVLVKQSELDVAVLVVVGSLTFLRRGSRPAWGALLLAAVGALGLTTVVLGHAASRGTGPMDLFEAVVTFRISAADVIHASATSATTDRLRTLLLVLLLTGAPLILARLVRGLRERPRAGALDLRVAALAVVGWESVSIVGGGSYWLHYLINLVPGLVLAVAALTSSERRRRPSTAGPPAPAGALAVALVSCLVTITVFLARPDLTRADPVVGWLQQHTHAGDTAIVAFGHPEYLTDTGLTSPYSELWSLPVRVRDPRLIEFASVISGASRPEWIVTQGTGSLQGWGLDAGPAQLVFDAHYRLVTDLGDRRVYRDRRADATTP